jgi:hypothetical protein
VAINQGRQAFESIDSSRRQTIDIVSAAIDSGSRLPRRSAKEATAP